MKTCPVCALDLEDTYLFCPDDGSSLGTPTVEWIDPESSQSTSGSNDETAGAVVLYCPTCAAEYPLTFSNCPVHNVPLEKHQIPRMTDASLRELLQTTVSTTQAEPERVTASARSEQPTRLTSLRLERPDIQPRSTSAPTVIPVAHRDPDTTEEADTPTENNEANCIDTVPSVITPFGYWEAPNDEVEQENRLERPGLRAAAIATIVALLVLGIGAMFRVITHLSRRSTPAVSQLSIKTEAAPEPFVATPPEALDYKEEQPATTQPEPEKQPGQKEHPRNQITAPVSVDRPSRATPVAHDTNRLAVMTSHQAAQTKISSQPMPPLPRGNTGGFDARLLRVRSSKTPSGVRYDLTFNMQEQAGRSAHWQRVLVSTRSASGINHSQAIPFSHRLGATGALTFTISVEMAGRAEADWQGRVVCTALGWDNNGGPLQASFGANVTP